ncbi:MAG: YybH family protein [Candidatus Binatia bacterium]
MRSFALPSALFLTLALAAAGEDAPGAAEAREAIEATNARFGKAVKAGDAAALAKFYTEDAILLPPDGEMARGRAAIEKAWKEQISGGLRESVLTTVDVERSGDVAVEVGSFRGKIQPEGKDAFEADGKYVVVWQRGSDATWRLHRDIWNANPAKE